jgi:lipoprotein-anchoring transpeptidase ErfK/SrfK
LRYAPARTASDRTGDSDDLKAIPLGGSAALARDLPAGCSTKFRSYDGPPVTSIVVNTGPRRMYPRQRQHGAPRPSTSSWAATPSVPKRMEGDGRTPEGPYWIDRRNPNSSYHLSLGISYPRPEDLAFAEAIGVRPGGDIFIHGTPPEMKNRRDWTAGCIAVRNREMEDVYAMVREGTPVFIYPA